MSPLRNDAHQPRKGFAFLYAISVLVILGAISVAVLECTQVAGQSVDAALLRRLALDAATSGESYAMGYLRYVDHLVNLRERLQNGAEYPGARLELWCGDRTTLAPGQPAGEPPAVRFFYGQIHADTASSARYAVAFTLRLNESPFRNRFLFSGSEGQPSAFVPPGYPEPPSSILYRLQSVGEVYAIDYATGLPAAVPLARREIHHAFSVQLGEVDPISSAARFFIQTRSHEILGSSTFPLSAAGDPDGF